MKFYFAFHEKFDCISQSGSSALSQDELPLPGKTRGRELRPTGKFSRDVASLCSLLFLSSSFLPSLSHSHSLLIT